MTANKNKVAIAMAKSCLTCKELQEKSGVGMNQVKAIIAGKSVRPCTFGKICKALDVDVEEVIENEL